MLDKLFSKPSVYTWLHQGGNRCGELLSLKGNLVEGSDIHYANSYMRPVTGKTYCFGWTLNPLSNHSLLTPMACYHAMI